MTTSLTAAETKESAVAPGVSKLAAKVAHELNNPLDAVLRFVSLAQRKAKAGDFSDVDRHLADAQFGLQRMAEVLRELMDIGRQTNEILSQPLRLPLVDLMARAMRTAMGQAEQRGVTLVARNLLPEGIAPQYDLRVAQVLSNVLKNAIEASPEQGIVRITVQAIDHGAAGSGKLLIGVEDSGAGLAPELVAQLFMPFVTSKPRGAGHGLGLAISRELILSLGGELTLENKAGPASGCVATIMLPLDGTY
jgi:signal transduction histidine kinase